MSKPRFIPLPDYVRIPEDEMKVRSESFRDELRNSRSSARLQDAPTSRSQYLGLRPTRAVQR